MTQPNLHTTVGQWVANHPRTSRIFEAARIDYCCGGGKPLEQACSDRQLDPQDILARLHEAVETGDREPDRDWSRAGLTELCNHIEQTHHAYLRTELPRLTSLIAKLVNAHGATRRELLEVQQVFAALRSEMEPHMFKEERVLFPAIRRLEQADAQPTFPFGSVANPVRMMEQEHDAAGSALTRIRELTGDYAVPADACNTYRAVLDGLHALEGDMHLHVHKENSILFPKAVEREKILASMHASR